MLPPLIYSEAHNLQQKLGNIVTGEEDEDNTESLDTISLEKLKAAYKYGTRTKAICSALAILTGILAAYDAIQNNFYWTLFEAGASALNLGCYTIADSRQKKTLAKIQTKNLEKIIAKK